MAAHWRRWYRGGGADALVYCSEFARSPLRRGPPGCSRSRHDRASMVATIICSRRCIAGAAEPRNEAGGGSANAEESPC